MTKFINMEKRCSKRKSVDLLETEIISDGVKYTGVIENVSEYGLHMLTSSKTSVTSFIPETTLELKFQHPSGKKTNLHCEVRWVHINKTPIYGLTYRIALEIIDPPIEYVEFFKTLK